ncbi:MAG TPA: peroxiredoxin, partial [Thermoanaerobaculia bacterium]|nr:peroxiredoxin [Thermoanaerobaculia bacterium]
MNRLSRLPLALGLSAALVAAAAGGADAAAAAPAAGSPAPAFTLTSNEGKPTSLADFKGKWVVLYFYPKDFTSGCTVEAHNFQRDLAQYTKANAVVLGVS